MTTVSPPLTTTTDPPPETSPTTSDNPIPEFDGLDFPMACTEEGAATFISSGNPCLDFFFHVVPNTDQELCIERLKLSWDHDALKTLKLICNLRGVRGTGKSDKENFYFAALWLHENHPKTLACNLMTFAEFGYFKDLPEILYRLLEGADIREKKKTAWRSASKAGRGQHRTFYYLQKKEERKEKNEDPNVLEEKKRLRARVPREKRVELNKMRVKEQMENARKLRKLKYESMAKRAQERYEQDARYRYLHDQVSGIFAELLKADVEALKTGDMKKITLAAKWCPSIDSSYDRATLLCKSIGKMMFPRESSPEFEALSEENYTMKVRNMLRKDVLVPLHEALKLPEVYMSAKQWNKISYGRVSSVAMRNYTDIFLHRDNKGFRQYLENVKVGNASITAGALLPHQIIEKNMKGSSGAAIVSELQWKKMVDEMLKKGKLNNCLAICDVSGSMSGTPMDVCVALGLLVSELSEAPWKGNVITFSEEPQIHLIKPGSLRTKTEFIKQMEWGMSTNFQMVFDKILEVAVKEKLPEDRMIKRLFVFSDMEFGEASKDPWETDYMTIQRKFKEKGYNKVPEMVFWNLRESNATPVTATQNGVAMVSGFSKNLLTLFLEEGGEIKPEDAEKCSADGEGEKEKDESEMNSEATMDAAIAGELYEKLVVYD